MTARRILLLTSLVLGVGLFSSILYFVHPKEVWREISQLGGLGLSVLALDILVTVALWMLSWGIVLRAYGMKAPWTAVWKARLSGYAVSYLTPSMYFGGEPVSAFLLAKEADFPVTRIFATILVAKILEGLCLILFVFLGGFYAFTTTLFPRQQRMAIYGGALTLLVLVGLGAFNFAREKLWATRMLAWLEVHLPWKRALRVAREKVHAVEKDIHLAFSQHKRATVAALAVALLATLALYIRPLIFFAFTQKLYLSVAHLSLIFAFNVVLSTVFWLTPGGLGIFEGGTIGIFQLFAIPERAAVAFSLAVRPIELALVGLGILYMVHLGLWQVPRLQRPADDKAAEPTAEQPDDEARQSQQSR